MKHQAILTVLIFLLSSCNTQAPQTISNPRFTAEADTFLSHMPHNLQERQTAAIRRACNGNCDDLEQVRNSRNTAPTISPNVSTRMLTPTMRIYEPLTPASKPLPVLIYFHGGGWTIGSINSCGRFCNAIAESGLTKVIAVDYRLAPENHYPIPLNDCREAVLWVREHATELGINPSRITVGGDSSGGNLAIATALSPQCKGTIESLVVFYPVTKAYADNSDSWNRFGKGYALDASIMEAFNDSYLGTHDATDPLISVGHAERRALRQLPRTLLVAAQRDILASQGKEFCRRAGKHVRRVELEGSVHLFITVPGQEEAFRKAISLTTSFIKEGATNKNKSYRQ